MGARKLKPLRLGDVTSARRADVRRTYALAVERAGAARNAALHGACADALIELRGAFVMDALARGREDNEPVSARDPMGRWAGRVLHAADNEFRAACAVVPRRK